MLSFERNASPFYRGGALSFRAQYRSQREFRRVVPAASRGWGAFRRWAIESYDEFLVPDGINKNGAVVACLGDISKLTESEQYHLKSENRPSDHSLGSEFDAQIECVYTPHPTLEAKVIGLRSEFLQAWARCLCTENWCTWTRK